MLSVYLKQRNLKGFSEIALLLNRSFYLAYPQIQQTLPVISKKRNKILDTNDRNLNTDAAFLINRLSFCYFIELLKAENLPKAERITQDVICLLIYPELDSKHINNIVKIIRGE